ncbi:methyltransferase domain-containing protein [Paracoccus sp. S-4012]|uniref:class I SAM-dependent methyltransferase n=1 Tax=Paracoccus sp. S-4012 TaxID=2665648 RepID=UPI0012AEFC07|nr:class I SAM-dependent methyltransferase [Paracoccus sp. S-4012]MRX52143.1 methyltransferase domain-containing protein [Paracoccus sp. S-4012]
MNAPRRNFTLKDEIRDYWSDRAATFDESASHRIEDRHGMPEWHRLVRGTLGVDRQGRLEGWRALDIACGTGEISRVLTGLGAAVTGVDFSETMLAIARGKLADCNWQGFLADAEALHPLADGTFDVAVTRHLAWTLTDPRAAYGEWRRVLKPGGRLLVVDGNWSGTANGSLRLRRWLADRIDPAGARSPDIRNRHADILARLPYPDGLTQERLTADLQAAGFAQVRRVPVHRLYRQGMRGARLAERLRQTSRHRFAVVAT